MTTLTIDINLNDLNGYSSDTHDIGYENDLTDYLPLDERDRLTIVANPELASDILMGAAELGSALRGDWLNRTATADRYETDYDITQYKRATHRHFEMHRLDGKRALGLGRSDRRISKRRPAARQASRAMRAYHNMLDALTG